MERYTFWSTFLSVYVVLIFFKIYQHHATIRSVYRQQQLAHTTRSLLQQKNDLLINLRKLEHPAHVRAWAQRHHFTPLSLTHVVTATHEDTA